MTAVQERASEQIIRDIIKETPLPPYVTRTMFRFESDWTTGEPEVVVYAIVEDDAATNGKLRQVVQELQKALRPAFEKINEYRVPYSRIRTESEQREMEKKGDSDLI
jgi:hypothetical protein